MKAGLQGKIMKKRVENTLRSIVLPTSMCPSVSQSRLRGQLKLQHPAKRRELPQTMSLSKHSMQAAMVCNCKIDTTCVKLFRTARQLPSCKTGCKFEFNISGHLSLCSDQLCVLSMVAMEELQALHQFLV